MSEYTRNQAMDNADAQIAEVIAGRISAQTSLLQGNMVEDFVTREMKLDSSTFKKSSTEVLEQSQSFAKSQARMDMKGLVTLGSKYVRLPSGQELCFVVRAWTYAGLDAVNSMNRPVAKNRGAVPEKGSGTSAEMDGFLVNDIDDF